MEYNCNLCGEEFDDKEIAVSNSFGDIFIACPNACILETISVCDLPNVKKLKKRKKGGAKWPVN